MESDEKVCPRCAETVKAAALVCRYCTHEFAPPTGVSADGSQSAGAGTALGKSNAAQPPLPVVKPKSKTILIVASIIAIVVVIGFVASLSNNSRQGSTQREEASGGEANNTQPPAPMMPSDEKQFIDAVTSAHSAYDAAANEMAQGGTRAARRAAICQALQGSGAANGWIGSIKTLSSNGDGKGVLEISIGPDITIGTWNNALSDISDNTLLDPNSDIFRSASAMKEGDAVMFSGSFIASETDCIEERSLTLEGSMQDPAFLIRFSSVSPPTDPAAPVNPPSPQAVQTTTSQQGGQTADPGKISTDQGTAAGPPHDTAPAARGSSDQAANPTEGSPVEAPVNVRPSFDCARAANRAEHLICADANLARLDLAMAALYRKAKAEAADPRAVLAMQQDWVALRRNACTTAGCLRQAYAEESGELKQLAGE